MKIKALVTLVCPHVDGHSIELKTDQVGNVRDDVAERMIQEGYAEKARKKDEESAGTTLKKKAPKAKPAAKQVVAETDKQKNKRKRNSLLGAGSNPDKNTGEDGRKNDGTDDDDSND